MLVKAISGHRAYLGFVPVKRESVLILKLGGVHWTRKALKADRRAILLGKNKHEP